MSTRACRSGPATSSGRSHGGAAATSTSTSATSPMSIGWTSRGGTNAESPLRVHDTTMPAKSWNCAARTIVAGIGPDRASRSWCGFPT